MITGSHGDIPATVNVPQREGGGGEGGVYVYVCLLFFSMHPSRPLSDAHEGCAACK